MTVLTRRDLLKRAAALTAGSALLPSFPLLALDSAPPPACGPRFHTDAAHLQQRYDTAVAGLARNVRRVFHFPHPVLIEGGRYPGIWLECGPQEGLVYSAFNPEAAKNNHRIFFAQQRPDGWLPCAIKANLAEFSQIQSVVPIAATALELAQRTGDEALLAQAYRACSAWDAWLRRYRDTRGTGLCEAFCGYDTGMDRNARFAGLPWKCPQDDARICPPNPTLPYLAPDLSANVYGGRIALARMAHLLGKPSSEADHWLDQAEAIRKALMKWCFDADDAFFYDRDAKNHLVRIRSVVILRVLGAHMVDARRFDAIYRRHVRNPHEFWTPYPFPSVAVNDPAYDAHPPQNSWCGPTQALTALRAPRWMEHYGKPADLAHVMRQWTRALTAASDFQQQLDPFTGICSTGTEYSPAMLVLTDFVARLYGVREDNGHLEWNGRLPDGATNARYELPTKRGTAQLTVRRGQPHPAAAPAPLTIELSLAGKRIAQLEATGPVRLVTTSSGAPLHLVGTAGRPMTVEVEWHGGRSGRRTVEPNTTLAMHAL